MTGSPASASLDLHGYTVPEAVDLFVVTYNERLDRGDLSPFSVVHGYGSGGTGGRIRTTLRKLLSRYDGSLTVLTDPVNPGVTRVIPIRKLPDGTGILSAEILEFCSSGKTESKVLGRFRRYGDLKVKRTVQRLVSQGKLEAGRKGRHTVYTAI